MPAPMTLKILLPFRVFLEQTTVVRIVAETRSGSLGLLPRRLDCVAPLAPGILVYETEGEGEIYVATDEGVLVKTGSQVLVSVRRALRGADLGHLHETVQGEFLSRNEQEQNVRTVVAKLEAGLLRRFVSLQHD